MSHVENRRQVNYRYPLRVWITMIFFGGLSAFSLEGGAPNTFLLIICVSALVTLPFLCFYYLSFVVFINERTSNLKAKTFSSCVGILGIILTLSFFVDPGLNLYFSYIGTVFIAGLVYSPFRK